MVFGTLELYLEKFYLMMIPVHVPGWDLLQLWVRLRLGWAPCENDIAFCFQFACGACVCPDLLRSDGVGHIVLLAFNTAGSDQSRDCYPRPFVLYSAVLCSLALGAFSQPVGALLAQARDARLRPQ